MLERGPVGNIMVRTIHVWLTTLLHVKTSFVKIVGGKDDYFVNVEIGEAVWYVPEDKEEASW